MDWHRVAGSLRLRVRAVTIRRAATAAAVVLAVALVAASASQFGRSAHVHWAAVPRHAATPETAATLGATLTTATQRQRASASRKPTTGRKPATHTVPIQRPVTRSPDTWVAWAFLDRGTGRITGSTNISQTNNTESMIKAWIAADDLRRHTERGATPTADTLALLSTMIRDSSDSAAETIYRRNGRDSVIRRLISMCSLTDTRIHSAWWSLTQMSPRDAVRMGACIANGRAAGPQWTQWLLSEMRKVRGAGRFGIISAVPAAEAAQLAIKNGWTLHGSTGRWNVNCLAISDRWILAVETRYPPRVGGLSYGAKVCADITRQVLAPVQP